MPSRNSISRIVSAVAAVCLLALITPQAKSQTYTVLHNFKTKEGSSPLLGLVFDSSGNLYGVASEEGGSRAGSVFELSPSGTSWTEKTLHSFNGGSDGSTPTGPVIFDSAGNIYGTTKLGGSNGVGVVYELTKLKSGTWSESILHNFGGTSDGQFPTNALVLDSAGNLYGTTEGGGSHGNGQEITGGTVFKLSPKSGGGWTETVLYSFGKGTDGASPRCNLILDSSGNLYGTTFSGGSKAGGTVFELSPPKSGGSWTEKILHNFNASMSEGSAPAAGLIFDTAGNLYGVTSSGEQSDGFSGGAVFELSLQSNGTWSETLAYPLGIFGPSFPISGVVFDSAGSLYFTYVDIFGTVIKLTKQQGFWSATSVHSFDGTHGSKPAIGSLILDSSENLYGAAQSGGANNSGVVFKIIP
jgi:uncharacterized repeat protein (TIGR03803 family)